MINKSQLYINNTNIQLPNINSNTIDITNLYNESGCATYDSGFSSTACCQSAITYVDGINGILKYRGYDIVELAQKSNFLEVVYLLLHSKLPVKDEYGHFIENIIAQYSIDNKIESIGKIFDSSSHPMSILLTCCSYLSSLYKSNNIFRYDLEEIESLTSVIIGKITAITAMIYRICMQKSLAHVNIDPKLRSASLSDNLLHMMFDGDLNHSVINVFDKILILHADHELNASTLAVRTATSTGANVFACIGAGIATLWGAAHGGANEAVVTMLEEIGSIDNIPHYIKKAKSKDDNFRLMGFGHRIYKNYDPRAKIIKDACMVVLDNVGLKNNKLLTIALELEKIALQDSFFIERKLYPNVDFYSGIIYEALGIPRQMFTVMFALARVSGWLAHWKEMVTNSDSTQKRLYRPRQIYTGNMNNNFINIDNRKDFIVQDKYMLEI